jgi:deazaflavin-dependent oxidoreductase (nitroreductase family)
LQRLLFRAPVGLYRAKLGFLLGKRFLMLEHVGRKSGETRRTVLEVVFDTDEATYVAAAWGSKAHWLQNIEANPDVTFHVGAKRYETTAAIVDNSEARDVMAAYAAAHPKALGRLASFMLDDPEDTPEEQAAQVADSIPIVRLPKGD